jgi:hypothetical protein
MARLLGRISNGANPAILFQVQRQAWRRKEIGPRRRNADFRQLDHHVGLAELPALGKPGRRGHVFRIALRRASIDPAADRRDVLGTQPRVVRKRANRGVSEPRRHLARDDLVLDRPGPRPRVLIGEQRHRRDFTGPMADHASGVQDRSDIAREGHLWRSRRDRRRPRCNRRGDREEDDKACASHH